MTRQRANPRAIKLHRTYSVEEAAQVLGVHKNSVRGWRSQGLEPIDDSRPVLFQGQRPSDLSGAPQRAPQTPLRSRHALLLPLSGAARPGAGHGGLDPGQCSTPAT